MAMLSRRHQIPSIANCRLCIQQAGSFLNPEAHLKRKVTTSATVAVKKTPRDGEFEMQNLSVFSIIVN